MPAGAAPVENIVLCAALDPGESSCESPESPPNPRFSWENLLFCSGGAGFELVEFKSYWYSMLEQICRACSHRLSIQDAYGEIAWDYLKLLLRSQAPDIIALRIEASLRDGLQRCSLQGLGGST
jgi:hypothetical protein